MRLSQARRIICQENLAGDGGAWPEAYIPVVLTVLGGAQIGHHEHRLPAFQLRRVPKLKAVGGGLRQTDMCVPQQREG